MVPPAARQTWTDWFRQQQLTPLWCDAKAGLGVKGVQKAAIRAGEALNARRLGRGMRPRAVRALVLGFPNVGKSALINRLVGQRVVESARRPGVTRSLRWVRLGQELDLLDAPGVLPPQLEDQRAALLLAICDDIGQAAYDTELVGLGFLRRLLALEEEPAAGVELARLESRFKVELAPTAPGEDWDPEAWLTLAATRHTSGDRVRMAQRLLDDFRKGLLGPMGLEAPPSPMTGSDNHAPPSVAPSCCSFTGEDSGGMDDDLRRSSAT
jgi:ribosome biogenesis GTPase A